MNQLSQRPGGILQEKRRKPSAAGAVRVQLPAGAAASAAAARSAAAAGRPAAARSGGAGAEPRSFVMVEHSQWVA